MSLLLYEADRTAVPELPAAPPRMISVYWAEETVTKEPRGKTGRLTVVRQKTWHAKSFVFSALRSNGDPGPPQNAHELRYMVMQAYALAACHFPIPSNAPVLYEVGEP